MKKTFFSKSRSAFDRTELLENQLQQVKKNLKSVLSHKDGSSPTASSCAQQQLHDLEARERLITDKLKDAKNDEEVKLLNATVKPVATYGCDKCLRTIEVNEYHYHSLALENLNYDLCESCFQSVEETEKDTYWPTKLNPWTQYAQVMKAKSVSEMIVRAAEQFAEWPCLGYRSISNGVLEDKFTWMKQKEVYQVALYLGAGIRHFLYRGLDEQAKVFVGVSGENSVDWLISDFAICLQSMVVVPIYTSLDEDGIVHIINTSGVSCVVCSPEVFCKFTACKQRCPGLKLVIQFNSWPHNPGEEGRRHLETIKSLLLILRESQNLLSPNRNISEDASLLNDKILSFFQRITPSSVSEQENIFAVVKHHLLLSQENGLFNCFLSPPGSTVVDKEPSLITCHVNTMLLMSCMYHCYVMGCLPQPIVIGNHDSLVAVVYTSGSTGFAKGVTVTNEVWLKYITGMKMFVEVQICKSAFAHMGERKIAYSVITKGGRIGIMTSLNVLMEDIQLLQPTTFSTTPRFFNRLYTEYQQLCHVKELQLEASNQNRDDIMHKQIKEEVLSSMKANFGKRLKIVNVGGAATSREVLRFMRQLFDHCFVIEGYGCTEISNIAVMDDNSVATLRDNVDFKLETVSALDYHVENPSQPQVGDKGELLVKSGEMCTQGYHNNVPQSAKSFADGWFHTGDIVEIVGNRRFRIIDRIKNFFKLSQGEFVSSEKLENIYLDSIYVDQVYITCADTRRFEQKAVFAVVVPQLDGLRDALRNKGLEEGATLNVSSLCASKEAIDLVLSDLVRVGKEKKLRPFEIPHAVLLDPEPFTVQNGCLTSSEKIARVMLQRKYQEKVNQCVADCLEQDEKLCVTDIRSLIAQTLGLNIDRTSSSLSDKSFTQHGGDSLTALQFTAVVKELFGVNLNIDTLLSSNMSLNQLSDMISSHGNSVTDNDSTVDLMKSDMNLELPGFSGFKPPSGNSTKNVFLTGSTGFLGSFFLSRLLENDSEVIVHCLIRCDQETEGVTKLKECFNGYDLPTDHIMDRVKIICGDLEQTQFGLDHQTFVQLGRLVSQIYHFGAHVNHVLGYNALRKPNVVGTVHVLELASLHNTPVHFVSSISVIDCNDSIPIPEVECSTVPVEALNSSCGYVQTKWLSEYLVWQAGKQGLPITIYRPGMISWSMKTGKGNNKDWLYRLVHGINELGIAPYPMEAGISLLPVDYLAQSFHVLSQHVITKGQWGKIFHLDNPNRIKLKDVFRWLDSYRNAISKEPLKLLTYQEWRNVLQKEIHIVQAEDLTNPVHKSRMDKLSGLLLFNKGIPSSSRCYALSNSINIGKMEYPILTESSFNKFLFS